MCGSSDISTKKIMGMATSIVITTAVIVRTSIIVAAGVVTLLTDIIDVVITASQQCNHNQHFQLVQDQQEAKAERSSFGEQDGSLVAQWQQSNHLGGVQTGKWSKLGETAVGETAIAASNKIFHQIFHQDSPLKSFWCRLPSRCFDTDPSSKPGLSASLDV